MFLEPANEKEVLKILKNLYAQERPGFEGIRPKDLKTNTATLTPIITQFINYTLPEGKILSTLKTAIVGQSTKIEKSQITATTDQSKLYNQLKK